MIANETNRACRKHCTTEYRHGTQDFLPAKRLDELLVFEHSVLDGQDAAHVEMFDAGKGSDHIVGLDSDDKSIGVVHLGGVCDHTDRNCEVHQASNSRSVFLQVRSALTTSDQRHVFPSSC